LGNFSKLKVNKNQLRPTFYFNNDNSKPIRAGGILFYKKINNQPYFLLIDNIYSKWLEDIGGKTDYNDKSINNTIIREVGEETNLLINKKCVYSVLLKNSKKLYCEYSKYLLYLVEADEYISNLTTENFGDVEKHTGFDRKINWYPRDQIKKTKLNPRLNIKELFQFIDNL
jgi:8-oxo-dGTP pyrophosphatase MutT (NUDIX family)